MKPKIFFIISMLAAMPILSADATELDKYEIKDAMLNIRTIRMLEPQIILGRRDEKHGLFQGDTPGTQMAQRAIMNAALDAFTQQGYGLSTPLDDSSQTSLSTEQQQKLQNAWRHLDQFTDAGMEKKPKMWPFSIAPDHQELSAGKDVDAIAFVQCYGKFDSRATPDAEVPGAVLSTVVQVALTGSAVIFAGDYSTLEFKLALVDPKTGKILFYRESSEIDTDVRDYSRLANTFVAAFKWYLPKSTNPVTVVKFKRKRSEILAKATDGGVNAPAQ